MCNHGENSQLTKIVCRTFSSKVAVTGLSSRQTKWFFQKLFLLSYHVIFKTEAGEIALL